MNPKQQVALNNVLKAVAAFLLTLVEEPETQSNQPPAPKTPGQKAEEKKAEAAAKEEEKKQAEADKKKKAEADKKATEPEAKPAETAKPEAAKPEAKPTEEATPPPANADQLLAECRAAAIQFAGKHGREALRKVLDKFTKGNIAEVEKPKLPDLLTALKTDPS